MTDSSLITKVGEVFEKSLNNGFLTFIPSVEERIKINKINVYYLIYLFILFF